MSKNASSGSDVRRKPGNPQETLKEDNFYYSGFFAAEMTCSVIKAANYNPVGHYYYAVDITVTNADKVLLQNINEVVMKGGGIISPVKGAFNLSARGKNRVALLREAFAYLEDHRGASEHQKKIEVMDDIRKKLRAVKETGAVDNSYAQEPVTRNAIGHILAGVLDGEGSFGFKKSRERQQPYFAVAMKDRKIIELCREFLEHGNVRHRKDGVYHYEINHSQVLQK